MEPEELAAILKDMYGNAKKGEVVLSVHLFGIKYVDEIRSCNESAAGLAKLAGLSEKYGTEVNKGCRLSKYVEIK